VLVVSAAPAQGLEKLPPTSISRVFQNLSNSKFLADPSMIVVDSVTGEVVFERNSTQPRIPASVIKLLATTSILSYMDSQKVFDQRRIRSVDFYDSKPGRKNGAHISAAFGI